MNTNANTQSYTTAIVQVFIANVPPLPEARTCKACGGKQYVPDCRESETQWRYCPRCTEIGLISDVTRSI